MKIIGLFFIQVFCFLFLFDSFSLLFPSFFLCLVLTLRISTAAHGGFLEIVQFLVEKGANFNCTDKKVPSFL